MFPEAITVTPLSFFGSYFLDYRLGNLTPKQVAKFLQILRFVSRHKGKRKKIAKRKPPLKTSKT